MRNLEREISKICRKSVKQLLAEARTPRSVSVTPKNLSKYLGVRRFRYGRAEEQDHVGQVTGLAWTEVGGELLTIEAAVVPGKGKLTHTGQLGEVMQESIQAAMTVVRSRATVLGLDPDFYQKADVHIHVPEGATPKDGPSAGIGMCTALVSALTKVPVRSDVAMTGEITLRGQVLPIGGLKEKLLAAHRGGIRTVLIPDENTKDLAEIPQNIKDSLEIKPVKWIDEVLQVALKHMPAPMAAAPTPSRANDKPRARRVAKRATQAGAGALSDGHAGVHGSRRLRVAATVHPHVSLAPRLTLSSARCYNAPPPAAQARHRKKKESDMNKAELIDAVSGQTGLQKAEATRAVDAVFDSITSALKSGDTVALLGFGTFVVKARAARAGRNPRTGETIEIAASKVPASRLARP